MRRVILISLFLCFAGFLTAQVVKDPSAEHDSSKSNSYGSRVRYGIASYYARKFNGRRTANGEIYDDAKLTAACNVLPLNTWLIVINTRNGKSVKVKVNDRMHRKNRRLIDLSRSAAKKLGFVGRGLTRVKVEVVPIHDRG
jgi:peptidoglycan lytic transglycosylase